MIGYNRDEIQRQLGKFNMIIIMNVYRKKENDLHFNDQGSTSYSSVGLYAHRKLLSCVTLEL